VLCAWSRRHPSEAKSSKFGIPLVDGWARRVSVREAHSIDSLHLSKTFLRRGSMQVGGAMLPVWRQYLAECRVLVYVVDTADPASVCSPPPRLWMCVSVAVGGTPPWLTFGGRSPAHLSLEREVQPPAVLVQPPPAVADSAVFTRRRKGRARCSPLTCAPCGDITVHTHVR
jgi:hypothetical protein